MFFYPCYPRSNPRYQNLDFLIDESLGSRGLERGFR